MRQMFPDIGNWPPAHRPLHPGIARRRKVRRAKAAWSSWSDMRMLTSWAKAMSVFHREPYVVDHIVPLSSPKVCGLHCSANLQVIPKHVNDSKGNAWWPDMPCEPGRLF